MERRRRPQLQRVALLCSALSAFGCAMSVKPKPRPELPSERLKPNEEYHAVQPCAEHILAPARVLLEVAIDEEGEPLAARVTSLGGTVRQGFVNCVQTRLMAEEYAPRGKATTIGNEVDLRVGAYSNSGSSVPVPPYY